MISRNSYALITGASLGIGRALALELSRQGINTLLVALDTPDLYAVKTQIADNYNTSVDALAIDLTKSDSSQQVYNWCAENNYQVDILINNAGFGEGGFFENNPLERYQTMIDLNMKACVSMTHRFLPDMKTRGYGHIMNTSSMEAFLPSPYKAVYSGTKNFVFAFSLALSQEVKRFGIKISILCPGPVLTNEGGLERIKAQGKKAKILLMMPDKVAQVAVKYMLKGMLIIIPGKINWWITKIVKGVPSRVRIRLMERLFRSYT